MHCIIQNFLCFQATDLENDLQDLKGQNQGHITKPLSDSPHDKCILGMTKPKCHDPKRENKKLIGELVFGRRIR